MKRDTTVDLNWQLEAYAAVAKLPEHHARRRWSNWPIYAAATGAALAGASAASAEIIYSGVKDLSSPTVINGNTSLAVDLDAKHDSFFLTVRNLSVPFHHSLRFGAGKVTAFMGGIGTLFKTGTSPAAYLKNFAPGARISGTPGQLASGGLIFRGSGVGRVSHIFGNFNNSGFVGFELPGKTAHGMPRPPEYGWIKVFWGPGGDVGAPASVGVFDWAYNTNGPILAGQTSSPVPEPSTLPILLIATGAAGVLAWKRRRSQQAANS